MLEDLIAKLEKMPADKFNHYEKLMNKVVITSSGLNLIKILKDGIKEENSRIIQDHDQDLSQNNYLNILDDSKIYINKFK